MNFVKNGLMTLAFLAGCSSTRQLNYPAREPQRIEHLWHSGYQVSLGNISYRYLHNATEGCTLYLGNDAVLLDGDCDGLVDEFFDNNGYHACGSQAEFQRIEPDINCNLANEIFQNKKLLLNVDLANENWIKHRQSYSLADYL